MKSLIIILNFSIFIQKILLSSEDYKYISHSSWITIKIFKTGMQNIYYNAKNWEKIFDEYSLFNKPDAIYINETKQTSVKYQYYLSNNYNITIFLGI